MPPPTSGAVTNGSRRAALFAITLPILAFYGVLARHSINVPLLDDYDGVLEFLEHFSRLPTSAAKLGYIVTAQHNEYKTMFANLIIALQYRLLGHPNFVLLSWLGNLFVLPLFYLLWRDFLPMEKEISRKLLLFVPISFLLFQLQYAETLNWSMPGLANIPILVFALACLGALNQERLPSFLGACAFLVLAIATSGNGFALGPLGVVMLLRRGKYIRAVAWTATAIACVIGYLFRYNFHASQQGAGGSALSAVHYLNPLFSLSFMGSAAGNPIPVMRYATIVLGALIAATLVWMLAGGYERRNPAIFYYAIFLGLTAIAVSGIRSRLGFDASHAGRYKIYSDLLLICCYAFVAEQIRGEVWERHRRHLLVVFAGSVLFCAVFDVGGDRKLSVRQHEMATGVEMYERSGHKIGPVFLSGTGDASKTSQINSWANPIIQDSEATGLYRFP